MSYSQALEEQIAQSRFWDTDLGRSKTGPGTALGEFFPRAEQAQQLMTNHLLYAETYFLASGLGSVIEQAGRGLPDAARMSAEMIPSRVGWLWLEDSRQVPGLTVVHERTCMSTKLRAISWTVAHQEPDGRVFTTLNGEPDGDSVPHGVTVMTYFDCREFHKPEFVSIDSWPFGEHLAGARPAQEAYEAITEGDRDALMSSGRAIAPFARRLFMALCAFIQQRILVSPHRQIERHARRRLERVGVAHEPVVRVIELRRAQTRSEQRGESEPVEWSHQWIVSGHWRQQWYPSLNAHQPRWVMPYVKGPENKPLKPPRAKVFAVVR